MNFTCTILYVHYNFQPNNITFSQRSTKNKITKIDIQETHKPYLPYNFSIHLEKPTSTPQSPNLQKQKQTHQVINCSTNKLKHI